VFILNNQPHKINHLAVLCSCMCFVCMCTAVLFFLGESCVGLGDISVTLKDSSFEAVWGFIGKEKLGIVTD